MINQVSIVLANYCPHCVPFSLSNAEKIAKDFEVPLRVLNIEISEQEIVSDKLVKEYGDWSEDYLIPQVFVEYANGQVIHLLTGFSEAVSVTKNSWEALFSSSYYKNLLREHRFINHKTLKDFVNKYLNFEGKCRRHCNKLTTLDELWSNANNTVGAYVCPDGYVSKVIYFSIDPDINWFKKFLITQVGKKIFNDRDLRLATRYGWELESDASTAIRKISPTGMIKEVYWTSYPKTDEEKKLGVFLCSNIQKGERCRKLFIQEINSTNRLCQECK
jgi:hypothetical protein